MNQAIVARPQRLSVAVVTKNSGQRLPRLLSQLTQLADEIVIGVDASSTDDTFEIATSWGDRVYRFSFEGHTAPARMLVLEYATGDWILSIDDDELLEDGFADVVRELISIPQITHAWFPRKQIVSLEPCAYAYTPTCYPDWQRRLFRNDRSLVHKPAIVHSGYWVSGPGAFDPRVSILHLEPLLLSAEGRQKKLEHYSAIGYTKPQVSRATMLLAPTRPATLPRIELLQGMDRGVIDANTRHLSDGLRPGWGSEILNVDVVGRAEPRELVLGMVRARNTGTLAWFPNGHYPPTLSLGNHLLNECDKVLAFDRDRFGVAQIVPPGATADFIISFRAPKSPGSYVFEWDMVSEGECWFASIGSKTLRSKLVVGNKPKWRKLLGI
jgi:hypothetical protein